MTKSFREDVKKTTKRPDYQGLALRLENEQVKVAEWFEGKKKEGVETVFEMAISSLKLALGTLSNRPVPELQVAQETLKDIKKSKDRLRHKYGVQDLPEFDDVERILEERISSLQPTRSRGVLSVPIRTQVRYSPPRTLLSKD